jgi:hypothetical protein
MLRSPLVVAGAAAAGTVLVMGGATMAVSGVALAVVRQVNKRRHARLASQCAECGGGGYVPCEVCRGAAVLRCRAPVRLRDLGRRKPAQPGDAGAASYCSCPACGTTMRQRCLNCLGEGAVFLPP